MSKVLKTSAKDLFVTTVLFFFSFQRKELSEEEGKDWTGACNSSGWTNSFSGRSALSHMWLKPLTMSRHSQHFNCDTMTILSLLLSVLFLLLTCQTASCLPAVRRAFLATRSYYVHDKMQDICSHLCSCEMFFFTWTFCILIWKCCDNTHK